jgi:hypothetical protein
MNKPNEVIVLEALLTGLEVKINGYTYGLGEQNGVLCLISKAYKELSTGEREEVWLPVWANENELSVFMTIVSRATEYEIDVIATNLGLNLIKKNRD